MCSCARRVLLYSAQQQCDDDEDDGSERHLDLDVACDFKGWKEKKGNANLEFHTTVTSLSHR